MTTSGLSVFKSLMKSATSPRSHGGETITMKETQSALRAIVFRGNMSVDKGDYEAAVRYFKGDVFLSKASDPAFEIARDFVHGFKGRWPDVVNAQAPRFEPGKLYSISRAHMPTPPSGYVWDLRGADGSKPGNVLARLAEAPKVGGYEEGKLYSIERANMPPLPQGYGWSFFGLDGSKPGHVLAKVVRG